MCSKYNLVVIKIGKRHLTACQKEKEATHVRNTLLVGIGVTFFYRYNARKVASCLHQSDHGSVKKARVIEAYLQRGCPYMY